MSNAYIGVNTDIPIYETVTETVQFPLSIENLSRFFTVETTDSTSGWAYINVEGSGLKLTPKNFGINSSTATIKLTALINLTNVVISGAYYTETNYDKISLYISSYGSSLNAVSGDSAYAERWSGNLSIGQYITLKYVKDSSSHATNESSTYFTIDCDVISGETTTQQIVGYENRDVARKIKAIYVGVDNIARKVKTAYIGVDNLARKFYQGSSIKYTGTYTVSSITDNDGKSRTLYTLIGSGTLTLDKELEYWMCGGGGNGSSATGVTRSGGGGGGGYTAGGTLLPGTYPVTIGAATGNTRITKNDGTTTTVTAGVTPTIYNGGAGGSGGGGGRYATDGNIYVGASGGGIGAPTYPFGIVSLLAHCAGGGGGALYYSTKSGSGGNGGSNGSDGQINNSISTNVYTKPGGAGGAFGGGAGGGFSSTTSGNIVVENGASATFYGSGGGGFSANGSKKSTPGFGYQGVLYLLD